jgi:peptidyl-prolyl cis-trans isomerase SurA
MIEGSMKRIVVGMLVAVVSAVGTVAVQAQAQPQAPAPTGPRSVVLQRVLVKVNGAVFTKTELEEAQIQELQQRNQRMLSQLDLQNDASLRAALVEITPGILAGVIDNLILIQRGKELGYRMNEEQFKGWQDSIKKDNQWDDAQFQAALKSQGMSMEELRAQFEKQYLREAVKNNEITNRLNITEEEARQYYRAHPDEFMTPSMMTLREIFIAVPTETVGGQPSFNAAADEAAQAKMTTIRERAAKGEDFTALVTEFSESASKANGGLIGPINLAELAEALRKRLEPLKAGDIDQPIRTPKGYQLLKVESRSDSSVEPFDKVRADISNRVIASRVEELTEAYLKGMRGQAIIEWKDEELKKLYEQHMAQQKKTN